MTNVVALLLEFAQVWQLTLVQCNVVRLCTPLCRCVKFENREDNRGFLDAAARQITRGTHRVLSRRLRVPQYQTRYSVLSRYLKLEIN
jgi:hypothetical protein